MSVSERALRRETVSDELYVGLGAQTTIETFLISNVITYRQSFTLKVKRLKPSIALHGNPSQSYGASLAIWDHTVFTSERAPP